MKYMCKKQTGKTVSEWSGEIRLIAINDGTYEVEITGRGTYFHVIAGRHQYGTFLCIPNHDVGCELSGYEDIFWNSERLSKQLKKVDALTVSYGLCYLKTL